jgi:hypothetical protein
MCLRGETEKDSSQLIMNNSRSYENSRDHVHPRQFSSASILAIFTESYQ